MFGASFPFRIQEKGLHKESRGGGGLGGPKILYAEFLRVLFLHLKTRAWGPNLYMFVLVFWGVSCRQVRIWTGLELSKMGREVGGNPPKVDQISSDSVYKILLKQSEWTFGKGMSAGDFSFQSPAGD